MSFALINGKIYTMDKNFSQVEAVLMRGNKIIKTGTKSEILSMADETTNIIDLKGKTVLPGFNDSHMHLVNYGSSLMQVDLIGAQSMDEIKERVQKFIQDGAIGKGTWVRGRGWNQDYFLGEKVFPDRYDLDNISREYPIILTRACGHVAVANSLALELIGIKKGSPQVDGGYFDIDQKGEPLGIFRENALDLLYSAVPRPTIQEIKEMMILAMDDMTSCGITSVGTDDLQSIPGVGYEEIITAYLELKQEGKLKVRIYEQCLIPELSLLEEFIGKGYKTGWGDELFKIGPLKLLIDGSLGARTAALNEPYADDPSTSGIVTKSQDELNEIVSFAHDNNMQIAIHGIGDKGMYMSFEAMENALNEKPADDHRNGIVHCQITDEYLLRKFKDLNAIAYIQPIFMDYDWKIVKDRIGAKREKTSYNWKTMSDMGINFACGSDSPVESFNVMYGIYEGVTRKDMEGKPEGGWLPDQALSVKEAVQGYTINGAFASFEESIKGSIEEGKMADMVVLSQDIFKINPTKIKDVNVDMTIFNGEIVFK
ncbi:MAG: amidohydrolase [Tissierellaceae bacterium]|nr:amidohydrolase [Tissierellaceae bacterium]